MQAYRLWHFSAIKMIICEKTQKCKLLCKSFRDVEWMWRLCCQFFKTDPTNITTVLSMPDDGPWQRVKILPYRLLCGAILADYGGKTRNIGQYLALRRAQKLPYLLAILKRRGRLQEEGTWRKNIEIFNISLNCIFV